MTEARARLATTIPSELDDEIRVLAAKHRTSISVVVTVLLRFGIDSKEAPEVVAALKADIEEARRQRAEIGREAMDSRYGRKGRST